MKLTDVMRDRWVARQLARPVQPPPVKTVVLFRSYGYLADGTVFRKGVFIGALDEWHLTYEVRVSGPVGTAFRAWNATGRIDVRFRVTCGSHTHSWVENFATRKAMDVALAAAREVGGVDYQQEQAQGRVQSIEAAKQAAKRRRQP